MKSKKLSNTTLIAILTVVIAICAIFTFVPMQFGSTTYTGVWGAIGVSSDLSTGLYAEYDIVGEANKTEVSNSLEKITSALQEQGYQSSKVLAIDSNKIRVEIGYPKSVVNSFSTAYAALSNVAIGAFELRSSTSDSDYVAVTGVSHLEKINVADYNGSTYLVIKFNAKGEEKFEELCEASETVYVYMGDNLQTSFSVNNIADYSQIQLTVANYESAKDFYYKVLFGSLDIELNKDTYVINTMSSLLSLSGYEGPSALFYCLIALVVAVLVAGFVFVAVKYGIAAVLLMPLMMLCAIISCWIFAGISMFEINVISILAVILGISLIFSGAICYLGRIAEEYKNGKTIDASIEAGTKKARPVLIVGNIMVVTLFAIMAMITKGQLASMSIVLVVASVLNVLVNVIMLPWFINSYNLTNKNQGKPFRLMGGQANEKD